MEASIQAVSPELIWELSISEGSVVDAGGGETAAAVAVAVDAAAVDIPASAAAVASGVEPAAADGGAV
jgi:hypothetical protein